MTRRCAYLWIVRMELFIYCVWAGLWTGPDFSPIWTFVDLCTSAYLANYFISQSRRSWREMQALQCIRMRGKSWSRWLEPWHSCRHHDCGIEFLKTSCTDPECLTWNNNKLSEYRNQIGRMKPGRQRGEEVNYKSYKLRESPESCSVRCRFNGTSTGLCGTP